MESLIQAPPLLGSTIGSASDGFVVAEWQDAGGPPEGRCLIAPLHVHHSDDEAWYVLEGVLGVQVGEREVVAGAGAGVFVARGTPHTYWNAGKERLRYLLIMSARIYQLIEELHKTADRNRETVETIFRKYDSELLIPRDTVRNPK